MKIAIFGAGGHARETADIADAVGYGDIVFVDRAQGTEPFSGFSIVDEESIPPLLESGFVFSIGIGDNAMRKRIFMRHPALPYVNLLHPSATFGRGQKEAFLQKKGNIIAAGACFASSIAPGNFGCFNLNCSVNHDVVFGDFVTLAPRVAIAGNVDIRDGAFVGVGAVVSNGKGLTQKIVIGENAVVGAGAVVIRDVGSGQTVKGVPAK